MPWPLAHPSLNLDFASTGWWGTEAVRRTSSLRVSSERRSPAGREGGYSRHLGEIIAHAARDLSKASSCCACSYTWLVLCKLPAESFRPSASFTSRLWPFSSLCGGPRWGQTLCVSGRVFPGCWSCSHEFCWHVWGRPLPWLACQQEQTNQHQVQERFCCGPAWTKWRYSSLSLIFYPFLPSPTAGFLWLIYEMKWSGFRESCFTEISCREQRIVQAQQGKMFPVGTGIEGDLWMGR